MRLYSGHNRNVFRHLYTAHHDSISSLKVRQGLGKYTSLSSPLGPLQGSLTDQRLRMKNLRHYLSYSVQIKVI